MKDGIQTMGSISLKGERVEVYLHLYSLKKDVCITSSLPESWSNEEKFLLVKSNWIASKILAKHSPFSDMFVDSWFDHFHQDQLLDTEYVSLLFDLIQFHFFNWDQFPWELGNEQEQYD